MIYFKSAANPEVSAATAPSIQRNEIFPLDLRLVQMRTNDLWQTNVYDTHIFSSAGSFPPTPTTCTFVEA